MAESVVGFEISTSPMLVVMSTHLATGASQQYNFICSGFIALHKFEEFNNLEHCPVSADVKQETSINLSEQNPCGSVMTTFGRKLSCQC